MHRLTKLINELMQRDFYCIVIRIRFEFSAEETGWILR